jgi:hypothetical protein
VIPDLIVGLVRYGRSVIAALVWWYPRSEEVEDLLELEEQFPEIAVDVRYLLRPVPAAVIGKSCMLMLVMPGPDSLRTLLLICEKHPRHVINSPPDAAWKPRSGVVGC